MAKKESSTEISIEFARQLLDTLAEVSAAPDHDADQLKKEGLAPRIYEWVRSGKAKLDITMEEGDDVIGSIIGVAACPGLPSDLKTASWDAYRKQLPQKKTVLEPVVLTADEKPLFIFLSKTCLEQLQAELEAAELENEADHELEDTQAPPSAAPPIQKNLSEDISAFIDSALEAKQELPRRKDLSDFGKEQTGRYIDFIVDSLKEKAKSPFEALFANKTRILSVAIVPIDARTREMAAKHEREKSERKQARREKREGREQGKTSDYGPKYPAVFSEISDIQATIQSGVSSISVARPIRLNDDFMLVTNVIKIDREKAPDNLPFLGPAQNAVPAPKESGKKAVDSQKGLKQPSVSRQSSPPQISPPQPPSPPPPPPPQEVVVKVPKSISASQLSAQITGKIIALINEQSASVAVNTYNGVTGHIVAMKIMEGEPYVSAGLPVQNMGFEEFQKNRADNLQSEKLIVLAKAGKAVAYISVKAQQKAVNLKQELEAEKAAGKTTQPGPVAGQTGASGSSLPVETKIMGKPETIDTASVIIPEFIASSQIGDMDAGMFTALNEKNVSILVFARSGSDNKFIGWIKPYASLAEEPYKNSGIFMTTKTPGEFDAGLALFQDSASIIVLKLPQTESCAAYISEIAHNKALQLCELRQENANPTNPTTTEAETSPVTNISKAPSASAIPEVPVLLVDSIVEIVPELKAPDLETTPEEIPELPEGILEKFMQAVSDAGAAVEVELQGSIYSLNIEKGPGAQTPAHNQTLVIARHLAELLQTGSALFEIGDEDASSLILAEKKPVPVPGTVPPSGSALFSETATPDAALTIDPASPVAEQEEQSAADQEPAVDEVSEQIRYHMWLMEHAPPEMRDEDIVVAVNDAIDRDEQTFRLAGTEYEFVITDIKPDEPGSESPPPVSKQVVSDPIPSLDAATDISVSDISSSASKTADEAKVTISPADKASPITQDSSISSSGETPPIVETSAAPTFSPENILPSLNNAMRRYLPDIFYANDSRYQVLNLPKGDLEFAMVNPPLPGLVTDQEWSVISELARLAYMNRGVFLYSFALSQAILKIIFLPSAEKTIGLREPPASYVGALLDAAQLQNGFYRNDPNISETWSALGREFKYAVTQVLKKRGERSRTMDLSNTSLKISATGAPNRDISRHQWNCIVDSTAWGIKMGLGIGFQFNNRATDIQIIPSPISYSSIHRTL